MTHHAWSAACPCTPPATHGPAQHPAHRHFLLLLALVFALVPFLVALLGLVPLLHRAAYGPLSAGGAQQARHVGLAPGRCVKGARHVFVPPPR